jgi:hypothetical protein
MQFSLLPGALLLSVAAAQTTLVASTNSACAAQPVLESCLASTQAIAAGCGTTDYDCLCKKWSDVLVYVPLPSHPSPQPQKKKQ